MTEGKRAQLDLEKGLQQMSNNSNSSSPATMQKMKADTKDAGSKIDSPTLGKPESERKEEIVVSSLTTNLLAERYKDRLAEKLLGNEDETDDEDDNDDILPGSSQSSVSNGLHEK
jgi:chromatin licensing and DNA replication factor 1